MANRILPNAPQGVRGVINGIEYPMTIKYLGPVPEGHLWAAMWPDDLGVPTWDDFDGLKADVLPAHTLLTTPVNGPM